MIIMEMFEHVKFYGCVTVGERGQIALPVNLRRIYKIKSGDKLLVLGKTEMENWGIFLVRAEILSKILVEFGEKMEEIIKKEK